ncbi:LacI family DNA-binding transcriptional regulator [Daejeonella sp.]|uniref:LacI family DNA-binding transcriptional regulator n=1 Tax=Daejeonella sp. TaxID=2805397 RepID=UPI0030BF6CAA
MARRPRLRDIADELNLTISGVSKALSGHPGISVITKQRVEEVAARLNYRPNKIASSLRSGQTKIIGVIIPSADKSFFGSIVFGMENIINQNGYSILLYQSHELPENEIKGIDTFIQSSVDGIIATMGKQTINFQHYLDVKKRNIPLVLFDTVNENIPVPTVTIDNYKGGFIAAEHLILNGYKRVAYISGLKHISIFNERLRGYVDALRKYNLDIEEDLIIYGKNTIKSGYECMEKLLQLKSRPDAVVAVEDFTALGAIKALKAQKFRIPEDVGVVGFSNEGFSEHISPSLTTINQKTVEMGEVASKLFFKMRNTANPYEGEPDKIVLEPLLIVRESSVR